MQKKSAQMMAIGGIFAALAVIIICLGGLIPVAVYICPLICMIVGSIVLKICGKKIAWAWYGVVSILALLFGPDKEAVAVYIFLGYYPILKDWFDRVRLGFILKFLYFNGVVVLLYTLLLYLMGMEQIMQDFREVGIVGLIVLLLLGNITFFLSDKLLSKVINKRH